MFKIMPTLIIVVTLIQVVNYTDNTHFVDASKIIKEFNRNLIEDVIIIPDSNPFFGIIGSYIACWYDSINRSSGLIPLLIQKDGYLNENQVIFLDKYFENNDKKLLVLGEKLNSNYETKEIIGDPSSVSIDAALHVFNTASTVMIIPYDTIDAYQIGLISSPLASYLNIPILIYDNNELEIQQVCNILNTKNAIIIGNIQITLPNISTTYLDNEEKIKNEILSTIKEKFNGINYITLTNPVDTISPYVNDTYENKFSDYIENIKITILGKEVNLMGSGDIDYKINIPNGINKVYISGKINSKNRPFFDKINPIDPIIFMNLYDPEGKIVAYSNSFAYDIGNTYLETTTINASGDYLLTVKIYNGFKGGYFTQRGLSIVNTDFEINVNISSLIKPHMPFIPNLSMTAPYLTSAHGGIIIADPNFELTSDDYILFANGLGAGPWYNESLQSFTNEKVNYTVVKLKNTLSLLDNFNLLKNYLNGPAWLAILADTNMIPMYYFSPSQEGIYEKGMPSDNLYSLDWNLSVGRIVGYNVQDVSLLISRTLFYEEICGDPSNTSDWHNRFTFVFGEGFGETGGIFHQIPYAFEILKYSFKPMIFGDLRNSRQMANLFKTYTGSNYIEIIGHGDWFWYAPSLYGLDYYSKAIDVAHAKNWIYKNPSIFLTSACLMGRIDGIPPEMNIGLTMIHAGCNCFVGSTRLTGSEAGLKTLENHLIIDNYSVGEALRGEKRIDQETPTYYVRTLYADPAFNPYEPNNGFSNQGRPILK